MTQDEIIEMAIQAGINYRELSDEFATGNSDGVEIEQMEAFAKLVAAKERDACADLCAFVTWSGPWKSAAVALSNLIRARGQE